MIFAPGEYASRRYERRDEEAKTGHKKAQKGTNKR